MRKFFSYIPLLALIATIGCATYPPPRHENGRDGRFIAYNNGVVLDTATGLEWIAGPDRNTTCEDARSWAQNLSVAGSGWRMPTVEELQGIYQEGIGGCNLTPLLKTTGWYIWSKESLNEKFSFSFNFQFGYKTSAFNQDSYRARAFAVRSRKCSEAFSEENQIDEGIFSRIFRGFSISPGITLKSPVIRITRKSDGHEADMTDSPGVLSFDIDYSTRDYDFSNTNFGWSLFLHSSYFKASEQFAGVNGGEVKKQDLGTSISGHYSYLIPALYYKPPGAEGEMKLGVGLGYGSARFSGSALFGPNRKVSKTQPKSSLSISANDVIAYMVFYDVKLPRSFRLRVSVGGPQFSGSKYKVSFEEFTINVSYTFSIM